MSEWSRADTAKLLATIATYDDRNFSDESHMLSWTQAGQYGRWELRAAVEAVHHHHLNSTELIKPAHVNRYVQAWKQDAAMRQVPRAGRGPSEVAAYIEAHMPSEVERSKEIALLQLEVGCPFEGCRVPATQPCVLGGMGLGGRRARYQPHPGRHIVLAEAARADGLDPSFDAPECPTCGAPEGLRCMNLGRGSYLSGRMVCHPLRRGLAA